MEKDILFCSFYKKNECACVLLIFCVNVTGAIALTDFFPIANNNSILLKITNKKSVLKIMCTKCLANVIHLESVGMNGQMK